MPKPDGIRDSRSVPMRHAALALLALLGLAVPGRAAYAQGELPVGGDRLGVRLEILKPFTASTGPFVGSRFATSLWDASAVLPLDPGVALYGRFGLAYASIEGLDTSATTSNPRLGVLLGDASGIRGEAHVDLPLAQELGGGDLASNVASFADFERLERYLPDAWSLGASGSAETELESGSVLGMRVSSSLLLPTQGAGDADLFALYSFFGRVPTGSWTLELEVSGIVLVTEDLTFTERNSFFASISIEYPNARFAPEVFLRAPVDESIQEVVVLSAGLRLRLAG